MLNPVTPWQTQEKVDGSHQGGHEICGCITPEDALDQPKWVTALPTSRSYHSAGIMLGRGICCSKNDKESSGI